METAEGLAVIEIHPPVGHIQSIHRRREALPEILAQRKIERRVPRQMPLGEWSAHEGVTESRAVIDVGGDVGAPRQRNVRSDIERVGLIVIESEERSRRRKVRQSTGNRQSAVGDLVRVREMDLSAVGDARRVEG